MVKGVDKVKRGNKIKDAENVNRFVKVEMVDVGKGVDAIKGVERSRRHKISGV